MQKSLLIILAATLLFLTVITGVYIGRNSNNSVYTINIDSNDDTINADKININTADLNTLTLLPGIGATKAQAIIDYREEIGAFVNVNDLEKVPGFGKATVEAIKKYITVGG